MEIKEEKNRLALFNDEQQEIGEMTWSDAGPDKIGRASCRERV